MAENKTTQTITSADIGTLSTSLLNKSYVHSLPTILLIRAHNRVELQHLIDPKNKRLQIAHTNLFMEMELREIEHYDTDPDFFTPSNIKWPFDLEADEDFRLEKFNKKQKRIDNNKGKKKKKDGVSNTSTRKKESKVKKERFRKGKTPRTRFRRRFRDYEIDNANNQPSKTSERLKIDRANLIEKHSAAIDWASLLIGSDETKRIFKDKAVATWNIQPATGEIPIGIGPRPKKEHWYLALFPPMGAYQAFMQKTLSAFYRRRTPEWAIQEWDIQLTVTIDGEEFVGEKRNFISVSISPYL
ncbi:MAG: hypothetical protein HOI47_21595 [Candidatus Scalindua sp.]|jgi:hypothetical protein|nr:hypothetical protein [Candidatus Scalindua sp.]